MKTLDDYAISAMQGLLSSDVSVWGTVEEYAECAYDMAEAMIKESRKRIESQEQRHTVETTED